MRDRLESNEMLYKKVLFIFFIVGLVLKMVLMTLFSSDYQNEMFIPFVKSFVKYGFNPYEFYYRYDKLPSFPYPPMMLCVESIGAYIIQIANITNIYLVNFIFKLPLLICDIVLYVFLRKMYPDRTKDILVLYFYSPIMLYSTYMHGQLDIIPTMFLLIAIYFLFQDKNRSLILFCLGLICSITSKFHILAVVPLLFYYLYKKRGFRTTVLCLCGTALGALLIIVPFWSEGFVHLVLFAKEQNNLFSVSFDYGNDVKVYLALFVIVAIYLKILQVKYICKELCLCFIGIIFSFFLILVPPMPGWFVWIVPFILTYFCEISNNRYRMMANYFLLYILYCSYFVFFHKTQYTDLYIGSSSLDFIKINNVFLPNLVFTLLAAVLVMLIYLIYRFGINSNMIYQRDGLPFTLGIAGDSGTGKSELLSNIESLLSEKKILYIEGDGDHRWERGNDNWLQYTHLDPRANFLYRQAADIHTLRNGNSIRRVEYNHSTGKFSKKHRINPKPYIIMCGLHSLYLPQMRKELDLKIYLDTDETLRRYWKIKRDTGKRGYNNQEIINQIEKRIPDAIKYIYPQAAYADLVIKYFDSTLKDSNDINHELLLSLKITARSSWNLDVLLQEFEIAGYKVEHLYEEDLKHQIVIFDGADINQYKLDYEEIIRRNIANYRDVFSNNLQWKDGIDGIVQLFIAFAICEEMKGEY